MAGPARELLGAPWRALAGLRGWAYDRGLLATFRAGLPVVSVGNLSAGGTGKTPLVVWLAGRLRAAGRRPGVLARGYGRRRGERLNDEGRLLEMRFPGLPQEQRPDRVAGAALLAASGRVDCLLLDDGFQHRRLHRDLDLVCLDCRRPWWRDAPLPAGRLREPPGALRRADLLLLTRTEGAAPALLAEARERAGRDSGGRPVLVASHRPRDVLRLEPGAQARPLPPEELAGRRVFLFCAIASPGAFQETVAGLGAEVAGLLAWPDHGPLGPRRLARIARAAGSAWPVTTEKDLARAGGFPFPVYVLRIDLDLGADGALLEGRLAALGAPRLP